VAERDSSTEFDNNLTQRQAQAEGRTALSFLRQLLEPVPGHRRAENPRHRR
jgi:hypothetical protein